MWELFIWFGSQWFYIIIMMTTELSNSGGSSRERHADFMRRDTGECGETRPRAEHLSAP